MAVVHPGAFCSPAGSEGQTETGTLMICSAKTEGDRPRWRSKDPKRKNSGRAAGLPVAPVPVQLGQQAFPPAEDTNVSTFDPDEIRDAVREAHITESEVDRSQQVADALRRDGIETGALDVEKLIGQFRRGLMISSELRAWTDARDAWHRRKHALTSNPAIERIDPAVGAGPVRVTGTQTHREPKPNAWTGDRTPVRDEDGTLTNVCYNPQGRTGQLIRSLGDDAQIDMGGGVSLADELGDLATSVYAGGTHPKDVPAKLEAIRDRLPAGKARRAVEYTIGEFTAPAAAVPLLPASTPPELVQLADRLNQIPLCRQPGGRELTEVVDIANDFARNRITADELIERVGKMTELTNDRDSDAGLTHIQNAVGSAAIHLLQRSYKDPTLRG